MLDFSAIPLVDNHCHSVLREQCMDAVQFRSYFSEATHPDFAYKHLPHTVYYLWLLRQISALYQCERSEAAVIEARNRFGADELLSRLWQAANIEMLVLDLAYPHPDRCYTAERISEVTQCRTAKVLRLETLMQQVVTENDDFEAVTYRFSAALSNLRGQGYCALKSIVAYRCGLNITEWSKDKAAYAFSEARAELTRTGQLRIAQKPLVDYLLHIALARAAEQGIPIQFHTGYGDSDTDLLLGNPLHLREVLERRDYWTAPVVLLHESYPYCRQGAYLAAVYPHVYFDLSFAIPFVEKLEMLAFTRQALSIAPASKLVYSSDGIHVPEMHWAAALRGREVVASVLGEMVAADELDEEQAYYLARLILHDTAATLYQLK
ncbi:MAG: amidohydrolase family protein [Ktedonobacteraceae bacterium]|nr:amidohydrolase family protein [Ktedonobacteraceae bacterium]